MFSERSYTDAPEIYIRPPLGISFLWSADKGIARTQTPTNKNYALELFTFETIVGVNLSVVQWTGLEYSFQLAITAPLYSIIGYCIATAQSC